MTYLLNHLKLILNFEQLELYQIEFNSRIQFKSHNFIVQSLRKTRQNTVFFFDYNKLFSIGEPNLSKKDIQELDLFNKLNITDFKITKDKVVEFEDINKIEMIHKVILAQIIATKFRKEGYLVRDKNNIFEVNIAQKRDSSSTLTIHSGYEYQVIWRNNHFYLIIDAKATLIEELRPDYTLTLINNGRISKGSRIVEYCPIYDCIENQTAFSRCKSGTFANPLIFENYLKRNNHKEAPINIDFIGCPTGKIEEQLETEDEPHVIVGRFYNSDNSYNYHLRRISLSTSERIYNEEDQNIINEGVFKSPNQRKELIEDFMEVINPTMLANNIDLSIKSFSTYENSKFNLTYGTKIAYQTDVKELWILNLDNINFNEIKNQIISILKEIYNSFWNINFIEIENLEDLEEGSSIICLLENEIRKLKIKQLRVLFHSKNIAFQRFTHSNYEKSAHKRSYMRNVVYQWYAKTGNTRDKFENSSNRLVLSWETMILNKQYYLLLAVYSTEGVLQKTKYKKLNKNDYKNNVGTLIIDFLSSIEDDYEGHPLILRKGFFYLNQDDKGKAQLMKNNYILVEISSGNSRIFLKENKVISNAKFGTCIQISDNDYVIITTKPSNRNTTAQPLDIKFQKQYSDGERERCINDIFQLTKAQIGYRNEMTKMPIPVHATTQIGKLLRFDSTKFLDNFESKYPYFLGD